MNPSTDRAVSAERQGENGLAPLRERVRSLRLGDAPDETRTAWLPWVLAGAFLLSTVYFFLESATPVDEETLEQAVQERLAQTAKKDGTAANPRSGGASAIGEPGVDSGPIALDSKGYIIAVHQIQVSPQVNGKVTKLTFEEGKLVQKGDVLALLEDVEYRAEHDRVAAQVNGAKARWQELWKYREHEVSQVEADLGDAKAQFEQARLKADRAEALLRQQSSSREDYEQAKSAADSKRFVVQRLELTFKLLKEGPRDLRIAAADAEVKQIEADLVKAKWKLDNCTVLAPITGTILTKRVEEGNFVNPAAFSQSGLPAGMCDLADLSDLEVDLSVSERDIAKVVKGQECKVRAEAYPNRPYKGYVSRIMPIGDRGKASVPVRVKIEIPREEAGRFLRPDMGALVTFFNAKS